MLTRIWSIPLGRTCILICGEILNGDNQDPHNTNKLRCTHQNKKETYASGWMLSEVDWGAHETHTSICILSEVDWGAHFSFTCIDYDGEPKDFFPQALWGGLPQRKVSTHLMEYLKDSLHIGQTEDGFFNFNIEVHILLLTLNTLEVVIIYLLNGKLGRTLGTSNQHHGRCQASRKIQSKACD